MATDRIEGRIDEIRLQGMLPSVFAADPATESDVWRADLTFRRGASYLIEAASGCGKSSMCAYIYGSRVDYLGTLTFNGIDTRNLPIAEWQEIRRRHLAYLPQELSLFPELTAWENIQLKNSLTCHASDARIEEWLTRLGIADRRDQKAGKMSVGQQQRVALIRALCQPFDFILLDEPVSHLDDANNRMAAEIVAEEAEAQNASIITTSVGNALLLDAAIQLRL